MCHLLIPFALLARWVGSGFALLVAAALSAVPWAGPLYGQEGEGDGPDGDSIAVYVLEPVIVQGRIDDLTDVAVSASQGLVGYRDFRLRPLLREGELLETVPGLIMTQHSGDGKSNQMFVRGFNLDHGTDFSTSVEGMPVNIPTHAHGHGYTDLNFIIPELVDHVEYKLGIYYADIGDFGSAGGAKLRLRRSLPGPLFLAGAGENGFRRMVAAASDEVGAGELLVGGELKEYDGPWAVSQDLRKLAGNARYTWRRGESVFSLLAMGYDNAWAASDQIPLRLVESGEIGRFSQVDSTLGGASARFSLSGTWTREGAESSQRVDLYTVSYDLELFGNFTYYLDDPVDGDQTLQEDDGRRVLGADLAHVQPLGRHDLTAGVQTRLDFVDVALVRTRERTPVGTVRSDEVSQWSTGAFVQVESEWSRSFRTMLGLRGDYHRSEVTSDLAANSGRSKDGIVSPKASLIFSPTERAEVYLSGGFGFHSNDARGSVQSVDPVTGASLDAEAPLVRSRGAEVGLRTTPAAGWRSTLSVWTVSLDSELVFMGDAGTTEPSEASRRVGLTWANFYRITPRLSADLDVALARARFPGQPEGVNRIPGALGNVVTAGGTWEPEDSGAYAALRLRHLGGYPLVEDGSSRAPAASMLNLDLGWVLGDLRLGASILNLLDERASDIQYLYTSRLRDEPAEGVEDIHFHPVEPRQLRVTISWGL